MNIKISLCSLLSALILIGCAGESSQQKINNTNGTVASFKALPFPDVNVPSLITNQKEAAEYLAIHWWDGITNTSRTYPCDSTLVSGVLIDDVEQKMANWTQVLEMVGMQTSKKASLSLQN